VPAVPTPPVVAVYQFTVPLQPLALSVTVPVPHLEPPVVVGAAGIAVLTVATVAVLAALTQALTLQSA
jgi:hypothetical protein